MGEGQLEGPDGEKNLLEVCVNLHKQQLKYRRQMNLAEQIQEDDKRKYNQDIGSLASESKKQKEDMSQFRDLWSKTADNIQDNLIQYLQQ